MPQMNIASVTNKIIHQVRFHPSAKENCQK